LHDRELPLRVELVESGLKPMRSLSLSTAAEGIPIAGRTRWYASSLNGTIVFKPSFPPAICTTTSTLSGLAPAAKPGSGGAAPATCASATRALPPRKATESAEVTNERRFMLIS
jgi:hypothetical protein